MFEKSLTDLIKGIRANPSGEPEFIAQCLAECRQELISIEPSVKQMAVLKLTYMQMLGHDVSWAAFHFVDVMSSTRFRAKRIGLLAASQTFHDGTDVLLLTTNLFRKAFASSNQHEASIAVGCLAKVATTDLARDLMGDVTNMLASSRPLLRKKAVLALYRLLQRLPEALVQAFPRLRERLDDPDPSVVACTVNVLTELATDNPKGYLGLAPALYKVLTTSTSNWTLIKVVKFLRQLVPHEPRLARKLVQPLTHLIDNTPAKSLQYECLYTVRCVAAASQEAHAPPLSPVRSRPRPRAHTRPRVQVATTMASSQPELASLAASKLKEFVEAPDPNLKSLGLVALAALQATDKALVEPCREAVLQCLDDEASVRAAALSLIAGMVTRASLAELVHKLLSQIEGAPTTYRDEVIAVILSSVRADGFAHVPSFRWLITTLFTVAALDSKHGVEVARLIFEVTLRVPTIRLFAAELSLERLLAQQAAAVVEVGATATKVPSATEARSDAALLAASYVLGEHAALLPDGRPAAALHALLSPSLLALSPDVQASCVQAAARVLTILPAVAALAGGESGVGGGAELGGLLDSMSIALLAFCADAHPEVTERARGAHAILALVRGSDAATAGALLRALREGVATELKAVAPKAQKKVKPPPELDLNTALYTPTAADWATLGVGKSTEPKPSERTRAQEAPIAAAASRNADTAPPEGGERQAARPRPAPAGPYYLAADARPSPATSADDARSGAAQSSGVAAAPLLMDTDGADVMAGGGAVPGPGAAAAGAGTACAGSTSLAACGRFGDEDEAGAVVDLHEDMPDGADHSDDEEKSNDTAATATPVAPSPIEPSGGGPMLADLLGASPETPAEAGGDDAGRRRRRRKHRSGGGDDAAALVDLGS